MRLLVGPHPGVHVAVVVVLALPAERSGVGPGLDDEVVGLLEALTVEHRWGVVGDALTSAAPDEAGDEPAVADHVDHRKLLGEPERVVPDRQNVAEDDDLGLGGLAGEDGRADVGHALHTEGCAVMLIEHEAVEAHLLGVELLVKVPVVELSADLWIVQLVADAQVGGLRTHEAGVVVLPGLLCEVTDEHGFPPACRIGASLSY